MVTPITNKAGEVVQWVDWCQREGKPHGASHMRDYILRRWPDLDAEVRHQIFCRTEELLQMADR